MICGYCNQEIPRRLSGDDYDRDMVLYHLDEKCKKKRAAYSYWTHVFIDRYGIRQRITTESAGRLIDAGYAELVPGTDGKELRQRGAR